VSAIDIEEELSQEESRKLLRIIGMILVIIGLACLVRRLVNSSETNPEAED
jgi:uncharacterized protein YjeT (DUF2065 family)